MKVVTVVGARPQFIKAAPVSAALRRTAVEVIVHTGQHYDADMSGQFFDELNIPAPDHALAVGSGSHGEQTGRMLAGIERILLQEAPDWTLVYGDTNSTLAGALAAAKLGIPVAHIEAGLRSFDRLMPEEVNRVVTDHVSSACFAPTCTAVDNLAAEGIRTGVVMVGDVMVDALLSVRDRLPALSSHATAAGYGQGEYVVATLHRAGTTDDPKRLARAVDLLASLPVPVILSLHPRTRTAVDRNGLSDRLAGPGVTVLPPLGYIALMSLVQGSSAVLTDSGGLQKEAYLLGVPCVTLRNTTEWTETVSSGWNVLVDLDAGMAIAALDRPRPQSHPQLYGDGKASERIAAYLAS